MLDVTDDAALHCLLTPAALRDADRLEPRLRRERLLTLAFTTLAREGRFDALDAATQERWRRAWQATLAHNVRAMRALLDLGADLHAQGLSVVLLKGAALLLCLYDDAGARPMQDLDILIDPRDAAAVSAVLAGRGWRLVTEGAQAVRDAEIGRFSHRGEGPLAGLCIEVHTHLKWALVALDAEPMRTRATPPPTRSRPWLGRQTEEGLAGLRVLAPEDALIYGLMHWIIHWRSHTYDIWAWELAAWTRTHAIEWTRVIDEARRHRVEPAIHHGLAVLARDWSAEVPARVQAALRPGPLLRGLLRLAQRRPRLLVLLLMNPMAVVFPPAARLRGRGDRGGTPGMYLRYARDALRRAFALTRTGETPDLQRGRARE